MAAFFQIPLNLPHAGTVAERIYRNIQQQRVLANREESRSEELALELIKVLWPYKVEGENPPEAEGRKARDEAASLGRQVVDAVVEDKFENDRLGQCVRNLFECLELGEEGAAISLRAGENPESTQRPL